MKKANKVLKTFLAILSILLIIVPMIMATRYEEKIDWLSKKGDKGIQQVTNLEFVELEELPEIGEENKIYYIRKPINYYWLGEFSGNLENMSDFLGISSILVVDELPTENYKISNEETGTIIYANKQDNYLYCYLLEELAKEIGGTTAGWYKFETIMNADANYEGPFNYWKIICCEDCYYAENHGDTYYCLVPIENDSSPSVYIYQNEWIRIDK